MALRCNKKEGKKRLLQNRKFYCVYTFIYTKYMTLCSHKCSFISVYNLCGTEKETVLKHNIACLLLLSPFLLHLPRPAVGHSCVNECMRMEKKRNTREKNKGKKIYSRVDSRQLGSNSPCAPWHLVPLEKGNQQHPNGFPAT